MPSSDAIAAPLYMQRQRGRCTANTLWSIWMVCLKYSRLKLSRSFETAEDMSKISIFVFKNSRLLLYSGRSSSSNIQYMYMNNRPVHSNKDKINAWWIYARLYICKLNGFIGVASIFYGKSTHYTHVLRTFTARCSEEYRVHIYIYIVHAQSAIENGKRCLFSFISRAIQTKMTHSNQIINDLNHPFDTVSMTHSIASYNVCADTLLILLQRKTRVHNVLHVPSSWQ